MLFIDFHSSDIEDSLLSILYGFLSFLALVTTFSIFFGIFFYGSVTVFWVVKDYNNTNKKRKIFLEECGNDKPFSEKHLTQLCNNGQKFACVFIEKHF